MLSAFQIDFGVGEFLSAIVGGLILTFVMRRAVSRSHQVLRQLSERPFIPAVGLFLVMFGWLAILTSQFGWPVPAVHDEFSYLLAADTYAAGRATNPAHPAWEFLETYHVISQPTYQSKYPPGNGLAMAMGQIVSGRPIIGMWLTLAGSVALAFWMLRGWVSTVWAVSGATVLICNWPITKLWGLRFYGGAPALFGSCLMLGAAARLSRRPSFLCACLFSCGLLILAITRPYEGLLTSLPILGFLACRIPRMEPVVRRKWLVKAGTPAALILVIGFLLMGWYNWRVTGDVFTWPYRLYESTYSRHTKVYNTLFAFTELGPRVRTIPSLEYESSAVQMQFASTKPVVYAVWKTVRQWWVHLGLLASVPFFVAAYRSLANGVLSSMSDRVISRIPIGLAVVTIVLVGAGILMQRTAGHPHYAAPLQPLILLVVVQGFRLLNTWKIGQFCIGKSLVSWFIWSLILFLVLPILTGTNRPNPRPWSLERHRIEQALMQRPTQQLVIVRYGAKHSMHEEWVYNRADLERAQVVWARDLGAERTAKLLRHFPGRDVSVVEPDLVPIVAKPYTPGD